MHISNSTLRHCHNVLSGELAKSKFERRMTQFKEGGSLLVILSILLAICSYMSFTEGSTALMYICAALPLGMIIYTSRLFALKILTSCHYFEKTNKAALMALKREILALNMSEERVIRYDDAFVRSIDTVKHPRLGVKLRRITFEENGEIRMYYFTRGCVKQASMEDIFASPSFSAWGEFVDEYIC